MGKFVNFTKNNFHFSQLSNAHVTDENNLNLGRLRDLFVDYEEVYPSVIAIQFIKNKQYFYAYWNDVLQFSLKKIVLKKESTIGRSRTLPRVSDNKVITSFIASQFKGGAVEYPPIGKVVLDRQIVDTSGKKVVRVNDIEFIRTGEYLKVTHASIGLRSLLRRIGLLKVVELIEVFLLRKSMTIVSESLINWKYVHAIPDKSIQKSVKLTLTNEEIKKLHPADLADILEDLDTNARQHIFQDLTPDLAAETLSEVEHNLQISLIKDETPEDIAKIVEKMGPDEAADLLIDVDEKQADEIISNIDNLEQKEEIIELLEYAHDTAGGLMSPEVFEITPDLTKKHILSIIQNEHDEIESIYDIYIVDKHKKLIGTCPLYKILINKDNDTVGKIMNSDDIKSLHPGQSWKEVAHFMSKYNLINVPIVDSKSNVLLGIISVDDILPWLLNER